MARSTFIYVSYIRTTPEKLWSALTTDTEFMKQYWFGTHCESQWTPGSPWKMVYPDGRISDAGEIVEADPPRRLVIRWRHQSRPELQAEGDSLCTMELEPSGSAVRLSITHTIDRDPSKLIEAVSGGWPKVISNLKSLLETGAAPLGDAYPARSARKIHGHAPVNGLQMYYEIEGTGDPLVYIPPAFGFAGLKSFAALTQSHQVITVDLQGNGRTADIPERPLSIEHYARDVVGLMKHLGIPKADFFGESYGASTAVMIAVRYPEVVGRVATYGATFGPPETALNPETTHYEHPPTPEGRNIRFQREHYEKVAPDPKYWPRIFDKTGGIQWNGFSTDELAAIKAPILIVAGDHDFVRVEHSVAAFKAIPGAELAVIPSASHFVLYSEQERVIPIVKHFLEKPAKEVPLATAETGYYPGETR